MAHLHGIVPDAVPKAQKGDEDGEVAHALSHVFSSSSKRTSLGSFSDTPTALHKPSKQPSGGSWRRFSIASGTSASNKERSHPLSGQQQLLSCIGLLEANKLGSFSGPLPRAQDVPDGFFGVPTADDQVIAVSHGWRNQAHPDPTCRKVEVITDLLSQADTTLSHGSGSGGGKDPPRLLLFFDFMSIPQRPFLPGQEARTEADVARFRAALECMHEIYFYSDKVIHLPWEENCEVRGEGTDFTVPGADLCGATFAEVGDRVQIASLPEATHRDIPPAPSGGPWRRRCWEPLLRLLGSQALRLREASEPEVRLPGPEAEAHIFDQVVAVDDELVTSVADVESRLDIAGERRVRLRSYPFGFTNTLPADERGWVFLERFITMVKCAMVDEETAHKVVITPNPHIRSQIMDGAARLRGAALEDSRKEGGGELKEALEVFTQQLQEKRFSAASTDKRELDAAAAKNGTAPMGGDRAVVCKIMHEFVEHLAEHWELEAAKQRTFARRLKKVVETTEKMLLEWDCFSEEYSSRLTAASSSADPWPVVVLVVCSPVPALALLLLPYARPDESWEAQGLWWSTGCFLFFLTAGTVLPAFLVQTVGVRCTTSVILRLAVWCLACTALCMVATVFLARATSFPTILGHWVGIVMSIPLQPLLLLAVSYDQRTSAEFQWKFHCGTAGMVAIMALLGTGLPAVNGLLDQISLGWQVLVVSGYLALKLIFEGLGVLLSKHLGADAMPTFAYVACVCYEMNLCVALSTVSSWVIVIEQIGFNAVENLYYLFCLWHEKETGHFRRRQYIASSLVLREFLEVAVPMQYMVALSSMHWIRPEYSHILCRLGEAGLSRAQLFLLVDIVVALSISCLSFAVLRQQGHRPLRLLRGLVATTQVLMMIATSSACLVFLGMQHSHWGMDFTFRLPWFREENAQWVCGLIWKAAAAGPTVIHP